MEQILPTPVRLRQHDDGHHERDERVERIRVVEGLVRRHDRPAAQHRHPLQQGFVVAHRRPDRFRVHRGVEDLGAAHRHERDVRQAFVRVVRDVEDVVHQGHEDVEVVPGIEVSPQLGAWRKRSCNRAVSDMRRSTVPCWCVWIRRPSSDWSSFGSKRASVIGARHTRYRARASSNVYAPPSMMSSRRSAWNSCSAFAAAARATFAGLMAPRNRAVIIAAPAAYRTDCSWSHSEPRPPEASSGTSKAPRKESKSRPNRAMWSRTTDVAKPKS